MSGGEGVVVVICNANNYQMLTLICSLKVHTIAEIPPPIDEPFSLAQDQTGALSVADNTWFWKNGTSVADPITPLIVHFSPNDALNTKDEYDEDFRNELLEVPVDSVL